MSRVNNDCPVISNREIARETYALRFASPELASECKPGQFINVRVDSSYDPLLRRPYSISNVYGDECEILYAVIGKGTAALSGKRAGDTLGIIGPLGNTYGYSGDFSTALLLAGGIGVAPFPLLTGELKSRGIEVHTFIGARSADRIVRSGLLDVHVSTDDGSEGFHGTVVELLHRYLTENTIAKPRIFACGPNAMLKAAQALAGGMNLPCELSLESEMACGIGICQGCPIERSSGEQKYALVCTDGPCFDSRVIAFSGHGAL